MIWVSLREPDGSLTLFGVEVVEDYEADIVECRAVLDDGTTERSGQWGLSAEDRRRVIADAVEAAMMHDEVSRWDARIEAAEALRRVS